MIKPYIVPFLITTAILLIYMAIRYHKLGSIKTIIQTIFFNSNRTTYIIKSIIAIARIPIGRLTIPMVLAVYILSLVGLTNYLEKKLKRKEVRRRIEISILFFGDLV